MASKWLYSMSRLWMEQVWVIDTIYKEKMEIYYISIYVADNIVITTNTTNSIKIAISNIVLV